MIVRNWRIRLLIYLVQTLQKGKLSQHAPDDKNTCGCIFGVPSVVVQSLKIILRILVVGQKGCR